MPANRATGPLSRGHSEEVVFSWAVILSLYA